MNTFSILTVVLLLSIIQTQPSTAQQSQLDCSDKLDIFFALDSSASLTLTEFSQQKQLVNSLLQKFTDTGRDANAGFLTFTEIVANVRMLTNDISGLQSELNAVNFDGEGGSLSAPLNYVRNSIFNPSNANIRPDSRKVFVLITGGSDEVSSASDLADISRRLFVDSNVTTIAMGLGLSIELSQLNAIATDPNEENVIIFSDFTEALGRISEIFNKTCTIPRVEVVSADTVSGSSVSIQWIPYNFTAVNHYRICLKTDPQSLNCNVSILNIDSTLAHVLVQDLAPNTLYYITMFAFTQLRVTPISEELQVETIVIPNAVSDLTVIDIFNSSTCEATVTLEWSDSSQLPNTSISTYILYLNGIEINRTHASVTTAVDKRTLQLITNYTYSIAAVNSNGASPAANANIVVYYEGSEINSTNTTINYNQTSNRADIIWKTSIPSSLVLIGYFLKVFYTYTRGGVTESYEDNSTFSLPPSVTTHSIQLTPHGFSTHVGVSAEIRVSLRVVRQCAHTVDRNSVIGYSNTVPPVTPFLLSVSNSTIDPTTCSVTVSISWTPPTQPNSHTLFQNGVEIATINAPLASYSHTTLLLLNAEYSYCVAASNCNATSPQSQTATIPPIRSYEITSGNINIAYDQLENEAVISWKLNTSMNSQALLIEYYLRVNYTYTRGNTNESFNLENLFKLQSDASSYAVQLAPHSFYTNSGVSTEISVSLQIVQECGQSVIGYVVTGYRNTGIQILQTPEYACVGDRVDVTVNLTVPNPLTDTIHPRQDSVVIDALNNSIDIHNIGQTMEFGSISLIRFAFEEISSNSLRVTFKISLLNYSNSDASLLVGSDLTYLDGNSNMNRSLRIALNLESFVPPFTPVLLSNSISTIDPTTCEVTVNISWTPPTQPNSHTLYQNGVEIATINAPLASYSHTTVLLLNAEYSYCVAASNCNATSPLSQTTTIPPIRSYNFASSEVRILYNQSSNIADLHWNLTQNSALILRVEYYLQINTTHTRDGITQKFYDDSTLTLWSNMTRYSVLLRQHDRSTHSGTTTEISVSLCLLRQCGQLIPQEDILGHFIVTSPETRLTSINEFSAIMGGVFGVIGLVILFGSLWVIIFIGITMHERHKSLREKNSTPSNEKKGDDVESKHGENEMKQTSSGGNMPSNTGDVFENQTSRNN